ncbi:holin [Bacillus thuringiensis]|uniref:phage holin family protein n=1 Tax=Bacillus thuringiensis TaxID=1428 RepID=UPI0018CEC67C|nr:phage holin family protein [Bacillus thuringiensis]MBG9501296.1 holin [Bacillus thuringiensis]
MDCIDILIKIFIATFSGCSGYLLGAWDITVKILVTMAVIDYLTSMIAVGYKGKLKRNIGFKDINKKVRLSLLVGAAAPLDIAVGSNSIFRESIIFFFMGNKLLFLIENVNCIGTLIP